MKRIIISLLSSLLLCGCSSETLTNFDVSETSAELSSQSSVDSSSLTEDELVENNQLFKNAKKMNETFIINGIEAKVVKADTSIIYAGNNKNMNLMGVYIYIDYPSSNCLDQELFKVVDINGNIYSHLMADGLDFLGKNRGEKGNELGFYRTSLPDYYSNFLLMYEQNGKNEYIHFVVERIDYDED